MKRLFCVLALIFGLVGFIPTSHATYPTTTEHHKRYPYTSAMASPYSCDNTGVLDIAASIELIKANQSNVGTIYFPHGTYKLATNLTIPAGIRIEREAGAKISIATGVVLTFNGDLQETGETFFVLNGTAVVDFSSNTVLKKMPIGTWPIVVNTTFSNYIEIPPGCIFSVATGVTLTFSKGIGAGLYQIFSWTGTGKVKFAEASSQVDLYPEWWGAVGDAVTDDVAALDAVVLCAWDSYKGCIRLSRKYASSKSFSISNFHDSNHKSISVVGEGTERTGIVSLAEDYPAMEVIGCWYGRFTNFGLWGSATYSPSVGLLTARSSTRSTNSDNIFEKIGIWGTYKWGQIYDINGSGNKFEQINTYTVLSATDSHWAFATAICGGTGVAQSYGNYFALMDRQFAVDGVGITKRDTAAQSSDNVIIKDSSITMASTTLVPAGVCAHYMRNTWASYINVYSGPTSNAGSDIWQIIDCHRPRIENCGIESTHRYTVNISSSTSATYYGHRITGISGSSSHTSFLKTDLNTTIGNAEFYDIQGVAATVDLGNGMFGSTFITSRTLTSFTNTSGNFYENTIYLPGSSTTYSAGSGTVYGNILRGVTGNAAVVGGGVKIDDRLLVGLNATMKFTQSSTEKTITAGANNTLTNLIPAGSLVLGVTCRVTEVVTGAAGFTGFNVGLAANTDYWGLNISPVLGTTTSLASVGAGDTAIAVYPAATSVILTAVGGNFDGVTGKVKVTVHYISLTAAAN